MSAYHRLISYIYAYEGGIKGKNTGFVKLETRGTSCRIQVSVRRIFAGSSPIGVYLLAGQDEIYIGTLFVRGGNGEFRTVVSCENVEGSGCRMEECCGLTIHETDSAWRAYTTIWEDAVAHAAEVELADVTAEKVREQEAEKEEKAQKLAERTRKETKSEEPIADEKMLYRDEESVGEEMEKMDIKPMEAEEKESPEEKRMTSEDSDEGSLVGVIECTDEKAAVADVQSAEPSRTETGSEKTDRDVEQDVFSQMEQVDHFDKENQESSADSLWRRLRAAYPKVTAFECKEGCEILVIQPQDIGLLPRENWVYGNNSFLLHGYYNYRYLILARLGEGEKQGRYILGVPGHYGKNEKYMAAMFGFDRFVRATNQPPRDSRFGYWYTELKLA